MVVTGTTSAPSSQPAQRNTQGITLSFNSAATPAPSQPQQRQTFSNQTPLVPNPKVTINGKPAPTTGTVQPASPNQPFLPRAIAPPVGDIAVSNTDSSPSAINLDTQERVPRLVLRDAPVREVLALLARAAGLNLAFSTATAQPGQQNQPTAPNAAADEGPRISLDIENESVQDVFNYVIRLSGLQANRTGRTIFVAPRLPNQARDTIVRGFRLNQVTVGVALNFLVGFGAETAVSRERTITSVNAVPVGGTAAPVTQTQTSTETRIETQRIDFQDAVPLLRGLQAVGDERTNSITLVGTPKQVDIATAQLTQLDARRRQVAVNVKIVDVNLLATDDVNTSFSFGIGDNFFSSNSGTATFRAGRSIANPPNTGITGFPAINNFLPTRFLAILQAQVVSGNAKILTDPTLIVQEGQQASVNLTQEVIGNITNQITGTVGSTIQTVTATKENVGLTLGVRIERIDDNGFVALSVAPIVRAPQATRTIGVAGNQQEITLINERSLTSGLIRLRDSQTLILSGIIQDSDRTSVTKVPILGDIPIIGALFRRTNKQNQRQEVIVLLTPQIIDDSERSSTGYNYTPGPEARQLLERRGFKAPKR